MPPRTVFCTRGGLFTAVELFESSVSGPEGGSVRLDVCCTTTVSVEGLGDLGSDCAQLGNGAGPAIFLLRSRRTRVFLAPNLTNVIRSRPALISPLRLCYDVLLSLAQLAPRHALIGAVLPQPVIWHSAHDSHATSHSRAVLQSPTKPCNSLPGAVD